MNYRNCECCSASYSTGKDYGNSWNIMHSMDVEKKGLCEMCNPKMPTFCCDNHGVAFSIGNKKYEPRVI